MKLQRRVELERLETEHNRRLHQLEIQVAKRGVNTPPEVYIEIEDIKSELKRINDSIDALGAYGRESTSIQQDVSYWKANISPTASSYDDSGSVI